MSRELSTTPREVSATSRAKLTVRDRFVKRLDEV
jgi:hypothetical protein